MLSATLTASFLPRSGFYGSFTLDIAIAYYENGQWISQGWSHLRVRVEPNRQKFDDLKSLRKLSLVTYFDKVVLLNQPLRQREYYFYIERHENFLDICQLHNVRTFYPLSHKYAIGSYRPCFWLEYGDFKKYNARYSGNGLDRFCDNVFSGKKWVNGWYYIDVGNASDYTIEFKLSQHSHTHYHLPHPPHPH